MLIGHGSYSLKEAARLARLKPARVREWFTARPTTALGAVFESDFKDQTSQPLISFLDLIDVFIAGQLREQGIPLQRLRRVYKTLQQDYGVEHPFGRRELLTDGKKVFIAGLDSRGRKEVVDVLTRQKAFPRIILPFLRKLEYDKSSRLARRWKIHTGVVLNPEICFGKPIIEECGIPTYILAKAVSVNGNDVRAVASWYRVTPRQVRNAVAFESARAA